MASNIQGADDNLIVYGATGNAQVHNLTVIGRTHITGTADIDEGTDDNLIVYGATGNAQVHNLTVIGRKYITGTADIDEIQKQTVENIDLWTQDTVEPAYIQKVLEMIQNGSTCVTITGSPGEGKSTLGYLVLKHLQQTRQVYKVCSPEQFDEVIKTYAPVILLDDIFGQTVFKKTAWEQWKERIEQFINMNQNKPINEIGNLILIGREFVLKSGSRNTEDPWEMLIHPGNVVNISSGVVRGNEEKIHILNSIAKKYKVHLDSDRIQKICSIDIPHGFPHTCKLFVTLYKEGSSISSVNFFKNPLEFLQKSLKILIQNKVIEHIFMEMIKGDGHVLKSELSKCGSEYITTANDLYPTYIQPGGDCYVFDHPSIMDTVAFLLCETKLSFILDHCSVAFIQERVWLQTPDGKKREDTGAGGKLMVEIPWNEAEELARRFVKEIEAGGVWDVYLHNAWWSVMFNTLMIQNMSADQLNVGSSGGVTLLHLLCERNRVDSVKMCVRRGVDANRQTSVGRTPLHWAALRGSTEAVCVLLKLNANANITDGLGYTALDLATQEGQSETASVLRAVVVKSTCGLKARRTCDFFLLIMFSILLIYILLRWSTEMTSGFQPASEM